LRILIAEDDPVNRCLLEELLTEWGHEVVVCAEGLAALQALQTDAALRLAILDWQMPGMEGIAICRQVRTMPLAPPPYLILLTVRQEKEHIVAGLQAGANDYVTKPFDAEELRARVNVGIHMLDLQQNLAERVRELEHALAHIKQLQGILPICMYCKRVRNDQNYWQQVESYLADHSEARFSHGICPTCLEGVMKTTREELENVS
jgi:CheY-like chemotaxis protein